MRNSSKHGEITNRCWKLRCPSPHSPSTVAKASHSMVMMVATHSKAHRPNKVLVATIHLVRTALHPVRCIPRYSRLLTYKDRLSHSKATVRTSKWAATIHICRSGTDFSAAATTVSTSGLSEPDTVRHSAPAIIRSLLPSTTINVRQPARIILILVRKPHRHSAPDIPTPSPASEA